MSTIKVTNLRHESAAGGNITLDSSGRVGIGTTSPNGKLVVGNGTAESIQFDPNDGSNLGRILFFNRTTDTDNDGQIRAATIRFNTGTNERARIDSSGRLLVGTSSTSGFVTDGGKFYIRNSGECMAIYNDTGTGWNMRHNATSNGGTFYFISFAAAGTGVGGITSNSTTTTYGTTSDYRLKENIEPITDSVDRLKQLNPCKFNFIAAPERTVDGFLAHEVQTHVPESVVGEKDAVDQSGEPVYQNIDQSKLVPLLTAALQEAIGEIESLKARLTAAGL
jgi:hypothetical protein